MPVDSNNEIILLTGTVYALCFWSASVCMLYAAVALAERPFQSEICTFSVDVIENLQHRSDKQRSFRQKEPILGQQLCPCVWPLH